MRFLLQGQARPLVALFGAVLLLLLAGCRRGAAKEEIALRAELRKALRNHSYEEAAALAHRAVELNPQENGNWDRLVQAEFGRRDFVKVRQTLDEWSRTIKNPSRNLIEYTGDLAKEENNPSAALQAWSKVLGFEPKNTRVLEKVARLEQRQNHWAEENNAWTAYLASHDDAMVRINRALCRRRLHRWQEAIDDLHAAQRLAPQDAEVSRAVKLFDHLGKFLAEIRELDASLAFSPNDSGLLADRALMFLRSEDNELALEDSETAAKAGPWAIRPKLLQAMALVALGRAEECEKLGVNKSIRLGALQPDFLETISRLDSEISVERNNAELHVARAWQLNEIGQPMLALQDAETAARLDARSAAASVECSYAFRKMERAEEAAAQIKRATELDPALSTAWQYRGELEMERGELLSAIDSLSHALENNQTATALQKREQCYRRLGLLVKAEQDRVTLQELNNRTQPK